VPSPGNAVQRNPEASILRSAERDVGVERRTDAATTLGQRKLRGFAALE